MAHLYRGEVHRMKFWRKRLDRTTNWWCWSSRRYLLGISRAGYPSLHYPDRDSDAFDVLFINFL